MKLYLRTLLIVTITLSSAALFAQENVTITEFMASNSRTLVDDFGQYPDWIELFNGSANTVNLGGWYLTDTASNLKKWQFPATNLNAGAFLVVFASGRDRAIPGLPLHTSFKISSGGGYLALVRPDGTNVASRFSYPIQAPDVSYGSGVLTTNQTLIATNSPALVRVPSDGSDGTDWTGIGFNDSAWIQGTNGVGYGSTNVAQADYSAAVLPTAPVGYWRLDESSGTAAVNLGSGASLNGTYNGATMGTAGPRPPDFNGFEANNNAPTFNGSSFVSVGSSLLNNRGAFTIAGWIKPAATPGSRVGLFGQNDCVEFGFISGTTLECWTPGGGSLDIGYPYPMNTWHHVVAVGDGASIRIFADGVLLGTGGGATASYGSSTFNFNIGGGGIYDTTGNFFNGQIDEVLVYHRALTTNEIFALYQAGTVPAGVSVVPFVNTDVGSIMSNINASAYVRLPFIVNDPSIVALLTLNMRYDDGFVAYVNGEEVARVNAPLTLAYNSTATNSHSAISAEEFRIGPGTLQAGMNILAIQGLNVSAANEDFLVQAELTAANITGASSTPVYFTQPTPGAPNSGGVAVPGPAIISESHSPNVPLDADDLLVTAHVAGTFNPVAGVVMRYRIMFDPEIEVQMFDDGSHGDGAPGDGIFGATIPASASTNGQMIRWYFVATDNQGYSSRWPLFFDPAGTPEYLGTIVDPTNVTSVLPIVHLFVDPAQQAAVDSQAGGRASVFYDGEFYDNVEMELRGNSTSGYLKKSHRFKFNNEHKFRHFGPGGRIQDTSFEADYPDPTYMRQGMSFWLLNQIGVPAPFYIPARLQLNAQFYQMANHCNVNGEELLSYLGYDPNGALYKAAGTVQPSQFSTGVFEKKTRKWEDNSDYTALANAIAETLPTGMRKTNIFEMLDLPEVISYLIGARFVQENDDVWANMTLYHDNDGDHLWRIVPFDMNLSWGAFFLDNPSNDMGIQATNDQHKSFPLYGSSQALSLTSGNWNRMYDVIFTVPETRQMFLRRMRSVLDAYVKPIGTAPGLTPIEQHMLAWRDLIIPEADNDRAKWGWPAIGGQGNLPPGTNVFFGVSDLLQQFFFPRRNHFYGKHSVTDTALPIGISKTQNAGIPLPQPPSSSVQIVAVDYNPSSGNQAQEYIQITNANPWAIDLSGWKLDGAVQFTFRQGTVIPSTSSMFVSPNVLAFCSRTTGPRGGQGLFVVGPYKGQLSARGESVSVYDNVGRLIHSYSFVGNPSPLQSYLRITEVMYHPAPPPAGSTYLPEDFEYIELKNIGPVTLNLAGVHFTNGIDFSFTGSAVTSLAPGQRVLVVKNAAAFASRYASATAIVGEYQGNLENNGETIRLDDAVGEKILEFTYNNSWYPITDGLGFSLVIRDENASWDTWGDKQSWRPSAQLGGSPSVDDPAPPLIPTVLINEALTRTDFPPPTDTIELYNPTAVSANIGGWFLTDDFNTPKKYRIANGTSIPAGGYITFDESQFNPSPGVPPSFALGADGDSVYLFSGDANTNLTGYVHGFNFGAAEDGVSFGRYVTSAGEEHFVAQSARSLGSANAVPKVGPIVISEIMYHPPDNGTNDNSLDEFIELFNLSPAAVNLYDATQPTNTWQVKGGVDFAFPQGASLLGGQYLLLVNFNPADTATANAFRAKFAVPDGVVLFGPYGGKLDNSSDNVELKKPTILTGGIVAYVLVDKVSYKDSAPWPVGGDGYGLSLQRKLPRGYGNDPINWTAASPSPGGEPAVTFGPPAITAQPTNQTILAYSDTQLSVSATGPFLGYQWRFHGMNIAGATNATLPLPNLQPEQGGDYQVVVYNGAGSQVSDIATVSLFYPVTIIAQPASLTARLPNVTNVVTTNLSFAVLGASSGQVSYQWRFNGNDIPGATNSVYTITRMGVTNNGTYQAVLNDGVQTVISDPATLSVFVQLTITQNLPTTVTAVQGDLVPYTISIAGFPPPYYFQLRKGNSNITDMTTASTTATFTLLNVQPPDGGAYRIVVTNLGNTAIATVNSTLTVLADSDGDHIPDTWETQYGFNPNNPSDGSDDPDHDGLTNLQEYRAGTNPTNALSTLKIGSFLVNTQSVFSFLAASNKTYSVQYTPSLTNLTWITFTNLVSRTTNRTAVITDRPFVPPSRFYRVVTPQQP